MSAGIVAGTGGLVTERLVGLIDQSSAGFSFVQRGECTKRSGCQTCTCSCQARRMSDLCRV